MEKVRENLERELKIQRELEEQIRILKGAKGVLQNLRDMRVSANPEQYVIRGRIAV